LDLSTDQGAPVLGQFGGEPAYVQPVAATELDGSYCQTSPAMPQLTWIDKSDVETSYKVERRFNSDTFTQVASLAPDTESYTDDSLPQPEPHAVYYRVLTCSDGLCIPSSTAQAQDDPTMVQIPTGC
jgi:hypothetical protein